MDRRAGTGIEINRFLRVLRPVFRSSWAHDHANVSLDLAERRKEQRGSFDYRAALHRNRLMASDNAGPGAPRPVAVLDNEHLAAASSLGPDQRVRDDDTPISVLQNVIHRMSCVPVTSRRPWAL